MLEGQEEKLAGQSGNDRHSQSDTRWWNRECHLGQVDLRLEKHKAPAPGGSGTRSPPFVIYPGGQSHLGDTQGPDSAHSVVSNMRQNLLHCSGSCELGPQMSLSEVPFMAVNCFYHLACDSHCEGQGEMHT